MIMDRLKALFVLAVVFFQSICFAVFFNIDIPDAGKPVTLNVSLELIGDMHRTDAEAVPEDSGRYYFAGKFAEGMGRAYFTVLQTSGY